VPLSIIPPVITLAGAVPVGAVPVGAVPVGAVPVGVVPVGAVLVVPVSLVPFLPDSKGFSASGSGFNI
jgi:hypothetical protein